MIALLMTKRITTAFPVMSAVPAVIPIPIAVQSIIKSVQFSRFVFLGSLAGLVDEDCADHVSGLFDIRGEVGGADCGGDDLFVNGHCERVGVGAISLSSLTLMRPPVGLLPKAIHLCLPIHSNPSVE